MKWNLQVMRGSLDNGWKVGGSRQKEYHRCLHDNEENVRSGGKAHGVGILMKHLQIKTIFYLFVYLVNYLFSF